MDDIGHYLVIGNRTRGTNEMANETKCKRVQPMDPTAQESVCKNCGRKTRFGWFALSQTFKTTHVG